MKQEREQRIFPTRPRVRSERSVDPITMVTRIARHIHRSSSAKRHVARSYDQKCVVKVRYDPNIKPSAKRAGNQGKWAAHARYLSREEATLLPAKACGFDDRLDNIGIRREVNAWQAAGGPRIFKVMISPDSQQADVKRLTRDIIKSMERDLGRKLVWVAVVHHDTAHRHAHVIIGGVDQAGIRLKLDPRYITTGIRRIAVAQLNAKLGYRMAPELKPSFEHTLARVFSTSVSLSLGS